MRLRTPIMIVVTAAAVAWTLPRQAQPTPAKQANQYESRYLVAGFVGPGDEPTVIAADFNRTDQSDGSAVFEYKAWVGQAERWPMPLYQVQRVAGAQASSWPELGGGSIRVAEDEATTVVVPSDDGPITLRTKAPRFVFAAQKQGIGTIRTAHVPVVVEMAGQRFETTAAYEHVRYDHDPARQNAEEAAEQQRRLDPHAFFGLYDWIVLWDEQGRLYQASAGTLTEDFAYRLGPDGRPQTHHDLTIRWRATAHDRTADTHAPTAWLVDVPAWAARFELRTLGQHTGHGEARPDGRRPLYRQIGVTGRAMIAGRPARVFGMVESILD